VPLGTLRTAKDYARAVEVLDAIIDEIGEDETHPMAELADALSVFIDCYEAADDLSASRAHPAGLLERGELPDSKAGTLRRISLKNLMKHRDRMRAKRKQALDELAREAQKHKMGY